MAKEMVGNGRQAEKWPHTDKRQEVKVDGSTHLYLIVQPAPSTVKSWAWRARPKGGGPIVKLTLGKLSEHSYAQAIAWADERTRQRDLGNDERAAAAADKAIREAEAQAKREAEALEQARLKRTVQRYYDDLYHPTYIEGRDGMRDTKWQLERNLLPAIGHMAMTDVTRRDLTKVVNKVAETAPVGANKLVSVTRTFFKRAIERFADETGLEHSPALYLPKPYADEKKNRKQTVLDRFPLGYVMDTVEDWAAGEGIGGAVGRRNAPGLKAYAQALKLVLITGCRVSEAVEAPWSEFDLERGFWTIPGERVKNGLTHVMPLPPATVAWLKGLKKAQPGATYAFSANGGESHMNGYSKPQRLIFAETLRRAKADKVEGLEWTPHALRRTFSTELSSLTDNDLTPLVPPAVVEALLNHQSGSKAGVAGVYNKYAYLKEKTAALILWEGHLAKVLANHRRYKEPLKLAA